MVTGEKPRFGESGSHFVYYTAMGVAGAITVSGARRPDTGADRALFGHWGPLWRSPGHHRPAGANLVHIRGCGSG
jgi:hypothetical protein